MKTRIDAAPAVKGLSEIGHIRVNLKIVRMIVMIVMSKEGSVCFNVFLDYAS